MKNAIIIILSIFLMGCGKEDVLEDLKPTNETTYLKSLKGRVTISKEAGSRTITVESNTDWVVSTEGNVTGFDISPIKGTGNGAINLKWGRVQTEYYVESTTINIYYYSNGQKLYNTILLQRNRD